MVDRLDSAFKAKVADKSLPACGGIILNKDGSTVWQGAYGTTNMLDPEAAPFTADTPMMIFSCTKLATSILALQLIEAGQLGLDDEAEKYHAPFADLQVVTGFDADGKELLEAPKRKITIRHLITHTAGFAYDFFNVKALQWKTARGTAPASSLTDGRKICWQVPLFNQPGEVYEYGINTDWLGMVVESVTGKRLADLMDEKIIEPLQMKNTGRQFVDEKTRMVLHMRQPDGSIVAAVPLVPKVDPEMHGGGEYLVSTINDYAQLLLAVLNGGRHPRLGVQILKEETVKDYLFTDLLPPNISHDALGKVPSTAPPLSNTAQMMPGIKQSWSGGLLLNDEDLPKGRKAGSGAWAGLGNLYYFIDPTSGKLAFFATNLVPFMDPDSCELFDEMERAVYGHEAGAEGRNYGPWDGPKAVL